jgi:hypothetical protein
VFDRVLVNPAVTVTAGGLFVAWQVNSAGSAPPRFELARVDQASGAIEAAHLFAAGYVGVPLAAAGSLWVTTTTAAGESLLRMNPADLAVTGDTRIGRGSFQSAGGHGPDLALAGHGLWVTGGNVLLRVSLPAGKATAAIPLSGAYTSGAGASADGTVLVVSEANDGGVGALQRRDPVTGALIASHQMFGVTTPSVGGVLGSGVWVSEPTGMMGYIERFSTVTMAAERATTVEGTNGISVMAADGVIWVTDHVGTGRDYCADPVTGRRLAPIPLPDPSQDYLLAISGRYVYYQVPSGNGFYLKRLGIPAGCRA